MVRILRTLGFGISLLCAASAVAQEEGLQPTQAIVRVVGGSSPVSKDDLQIKVNGHGVPVTRVRPVLGANGHVEIALLIDDGLRGNFANNLSEVQRFVLSLPPNVAIGVGYMQNGRVIFSHGFSVEHEEAVKAIRLPFGQAGISGSPYFCLSDLAKSWPTNTGAPRVVVMITNGIDPYNGSVSPMNQNSPYVDTAIHDAQEHGLTVYAIPWNNRDFGGLGLGSFSGQNYLSDVVTSTGGELLGQGTINPPSIRPMLDKFMADLGESFLISFDAPANKRLLDLKVTAKVHGTKVSAPKAIRAGNAAQ
ncbi:hypothetical protein [Terriglobus saanensis]|uniref:VWFA-related domain-containing protein n=1 Tax=Terriglobus saanensis (strain ATCC BAA-1853 / DSM 23119 / SP1PR4) TaxID=401053 RepID=E8UX39_TERSS|nr:hypothetical protein [Terriglobus saanensis]ADV83002.1 hypothetical protein AciPR4_2200 [Terriglobus saanensis SP1PR4]